MDKKLKILILEDLEDDAGLIRHTLHKNGLSCEVKRVDTKKEYLEALKTEHHDVILSDHALPQFNSIEALKIFKELGLNVPFILVTGTVSEEFAVTCLKQGADDYVLKSNLTRLVPAITHALKQRELHENKIKAEAKLQAQNEALKKVNQELDSFVYSVSHNIRAPLLSLLGLLNLAKKEDHAHGDNFEEYFAMMTGSIVKLDDTLKEILEYSRNARDKLQIHKIDLKTLIEGCFNGQKYMEGAEPINKEIIIEKDHPFYSDKHRVAFIFNNLISNSIKYRDVEKGTCWLHIKANVDAKRATIVVEDNGIGIPDAYQKKVFNMFYRATELSQGAGLGLYIVKETITKLKGQITLESRLGEGTKYTIRLPNKIP